VFIRVHLWFHSGLCSNCQNAKGVKAIAETLKIRSAELNAPFPTHCSAISENCAFLAKLEPPFCKPDRSVAGRAKLAKAAKERNHFANFASFARLISVPPR
jgi:hypothetical protein